VPEDVVGLHHWTILLESVDQVAEVRDRVRAAGLAAADVTGGFAVADPWGIAVHVVVSG
jgi:hypothetical protein